MTKRRLEIFAKISFPPALIVHLCKTWNCSSRLRSSRPLPDYPNPERAHERRERCRRSRHILRMTHGNFFSTSSWASDDPSFLFSIEDLDNLSCNHERKAEFKNDLKKLWIFHIAKLYDNDFSVNQWFTYLVRNFYCQVIIDEVRANLTAT